MREKIYSESVLSSIYEIVQEKGIVTRDEFKSMDSRSFGRDLLSSFEPYLENLGEPIVFGDDAFDHDDCGEDDEIFACAEFHLENWVDYSGVLFDLRKFSYKKAEEYLKKNVLKYPEENAAE